MMGDGQKGKWGERRVKMHGDHRKKAVALMIGT
jgi:hypothetical protein